MRKQKLSRRQTVGAGLAAAGLIGAAVAGSTVASAAPAPEAAGHGTTGHGTAAGTTVLRGSTTTPIKHLVVLFDENVSFDHYFGTYPKATNRDGVRFTASRHTPKVDDYLAHPALLKARSARNPNGNPNAMPPFRYSPDEAVTCDQGHNYTPEEKAVDGGAMDKFVESVSGDTCGLLNRVGQTMGYYDGNTVTGLWNYAQHYAMSDNAWSDTFGPSTPGALEVVSGQTHGVRSYDPASGTEHPTQTATPDAYAVHAPDANGVGTVIGDPDPVYDDCADANHTKTSPLAGMTDDKNVGDLLNAKQVTWGWFQGGFAPDVPYAGPGTYAQCTHTSKNVDGTPDVDYNPHHEPFQYYASTANPHHLAPASLEEVGHDGQANHQYDLSLFSDALSGKGGASLPAVSYLKARNVEDGHAAYSDPLDEQHFLVRTINEIQRSKYWKDTAIVVTYDDTDGWYDHVAPTITNASSTADDVNTCTAPAAAGVPILQGFQDRCGPGQRIPFLVISPYAKKDAVDSHLITQSSVVRFIEDNWGLGRIGGGSFDEHAGSLNGLLDLRHPSNGRLILRSNGSIARSQH